jgi:hypothetical protein
MPLAYVALALPLRVDKNLALALPLRVDKNLALALPLISASAERNVRSV